MHNLSSRQLAVGYVIKHIYSAKVNRLHIWRDNAIKNWQNCPHYSFLLAKRFMPI
jgi:hypothetical protein